MSAGPLRALRHRNFRLYLTGQGVSIIGSWMQQVAMAWLTYQLTESAVWLGLVGFAGQIPALVVTPVAGALIDRRDRRRLLFVTQTLMMSQALILAVLTLSGTVEVGHIFALALLLGTVNAVDIPTRQSLLSELVGAGEDLANAIALNSSVFNGARLVGPALAGVLLSLTSPGVCFLVNAGSYLAVVVALLVMHLPQRELPQARESLCAGLGAGLAYAWQSAPIRSALLLIGLFNLAGMAEMTLLPVIAATNLQGDAATLALLSAAAGAGAFAAALFLASRRGIPGLEGCILTATLAYGLGLVAFSFAASLWASALLVTVTGSSLLLLTAGANTLLQHIVAEEKRGRVMSLYTTMVTGLAPLGGLVAGCVAEYAGVSLTLRLAGAACLAGAVGFALLWPRQPLPASAQAKTEAAPLILPSATLAPVGFRFTAKEQHISG